MYLIVIVCAFFLIAFSAALYFLLRARRRLAWLEVELSTLAHDVEQTDGEVSALWADAAGSCILVEIIDPLTLARRRTVEMRQRLTAAAGGFGEARTVAEARARLRARQKRVQAAVETGTTGIETAHRAVATYLGHRRGDGGGRFYARVRGVNRGIGDVIAGWLAPRKHARREESPSRGRVRRGNDGD